MRIWPLRFFERKSAPVGSLGGFWESFFAGFVTTSAGASVSPASALHVPAVAACVRTISEAPASLGVHVVEIADDRTETRIPDHPAAAFLTDEANSWTSGFELIRQIMIDALTRDEGGLCYANWIGNELREIIRYHPGVISVDLSQPTGEPIYRVDNQETPAHKIIHLRNAFDRSPVSLAREAIGVALSMEKHAGNLFGRGARPGGIIKTPKNVGDDGVKRMLAGWKAAHEGPDKSGKTAILWDGAEFVSMTMSSVDAQFQELRLFQLQEIARAFNIPSVLLGDLSRATWSNSAEMQKLFLMLCLEPWLRALEGAFRRALFKPDDRKKYAVRFDREDFSKVDLSTLAVAINGLVSARVLNPNEGRDWLGMPKGPAELDQFANPNTGASQPLKEPARAA